jgi:hypothetical protein
MPEAMTLEQELILLGGGLEWPVARDLAPAVRLRFKPVRRPWTESRWAMAAAVAIVVLSALVAYTPSRDAIAGWLNLHTRIERVNTLPTPSPLRPGPLGQRLGLGGRTTLGAAGVAVSWPVLVPASQGAPDEVYLNLPARGQPRE